MLAVCSDPDRCLAVCLDPDHCLLHLTMKINVNESLSREQTERNLKKNACRYFLTLVGEPVCLVCALIFAVIHEVVTR